MLQMSPRVRIYVRFLVFHMLIFSLMRGAFFLLFRDSTSPLAAEVVAKSFYLGAKFDLRATIFLLLPLVSLSWLRPLHLRTRTLLWANIYAVLAVGWLAVYLLDFGYYAYLKTRVNATFVTFLFNPLSSAQMIIENYPVVWGSLLSLLFLYVYHNFLRRYVLHQDFYPLNEAKRSYAWGHALFALMCLGGLYGKLSYYPLRWSEAFFSPEPFASNLALNPQLYLAQTLRHRDLNYDAEKLRQHYDLLAEYFEVSQPEKETLNFIRHIPAKAKFSGKSPNVILVVMESYASYKTALRNNPLDAGPFLSKLAKEGVYFSEYYVPVEGTARSMFALMSGVADLSTYKTASRNPLIVEQNVLLDYFDEHDKLYMIGGSANWGNIRAVFSNNVKDIEIVEEGEYSEPRVDVWGLSDYHLFKEVIAKLKKRSSDKPFFAVVQAASYHRPYSIPENIPGFQYIEKSEAELSHAGFISNQEYNSFRFSDFSLQKFFEWAEKEPWYEDTIFVVTGDHGIPDNGAPFDVRSRVETETAPFHVPLVFFSTKFLPQPMQIDRVASEVDVLPSIAGLLGIEYKNQAMGRDLFNPAYDSKRFAFTYTYHRRGEYGLIGEGHYLKVKPSGRFLYALNNPLGAIDVKEQSPELYQRMSNLTDALFEFGKYMLHNNKSLRENRAALN